MMFILLGAAFGFWLGNFYGFVLGGVLGYLMSRAVRSDSDERFEAVYSQFVDATFEVMGALCKADGVVTHDEIQAVEQAFLRLELSEEERSSGKAAFQRGKTPEFDLDASVQRFAAGAGGNQILFQLFLQLQLMAVMADGQLHPAEREMLVRVARGLGLSELHIAQLEALLHAASAGPAESAGSNGAGSNGAGSNGAGSNGAGSNRAAPRDRLKDAYTALGVTAETPDAEIKRAYRKLISETHPDKLSAQGVPKNLRELAEVRTREVNAAYDVLKRARNFT